MIDNPVSAFGQPPRFDRIRPEHVEPAITTLVARQNEGLIALEKSVKPTWAGTIVALRRLKEPLEYAWSVVEHLMSVRNTDALRQSYGSVQGRVIEARTRIRQSEPIYRALKLLRGGSEWPQLEKAQQRIVESAIRQAEQLGVSLTGVNRARFNAIQVELADLSMRFADNVLDADRAFGMVLREKSEVDGLPDGLLGVAAQAACRNDFPDATSERGPWRISTDAAISSPFLQHARRRDLRERLYRAVITRASAQPYDNQPNVERILALRREQVHLLGFATYADLSVSKKMAGSVAAVERLLNELREVARPRAQQELAELTEFARAQSGDPSLELAHWDMAFWAERLREGKFSYNEESLRPFFPLPQVLDGLFALVHHLFGVSIVAADGEVSVWHPDVRFFQVRDGQGRPLAAFYLDPYSRPQDKRDGAWMNVCLDREGTVDGVRLPIAYLICNQNAPIGSAPSLMTFDDVGTLFHEFGHGLQHMLTTIDYPEAAGINNVEWDAVELPSQFMENWCYHQPTLLSFVRHYQTGAPLPQDLLEKISAARHFRNGSALQRQIYLATIDLELHRSFDVGRDDFSAFARSVQRDNATVMPLAEDRHLCSFLHIFAGLYDNGYAAGFYSYKWAEVLSADAFSAFEEAGVDDPQALQRLGRKFRDTVLTCGGGQHPMEIFKAFRGREPSTMPLLRHRGLV